MGPVIVRHAVLAARSLLLLVFEVRMLLLVLAAVAIGDGTVSIHGAPI